MIHGITIVDSKGEQDKTAERFIIFVLFSYFLAGIAVGWGLRWYFG